MYIYSTLLCLFILYIFQTTIIAEKKITDERLNIKEID